MKRFLSALTLTIVMFGLLTAEANAAGGPFQKWLAAGKTSRKATSKTASGGLFHASPYARYQSVDDLYPRYIGAFHSRYFNDLGIPTGDVGARANTLYMLPW